MTVVEGNLKAPFSIVNTLKLHFTLETYLIILSDKQVGIKYHFKSLCYDMI